MALSTETRSIPRTEQVIKCDRCGNEIDPVADTNYFWLKAYKVTGSPADEYRPVQQFDYCFYCAPILKNTLQNLKGTRP